MAATTSIRGDTVRKDSVHAQEGYKWQDDKVLVMDEEDEVDTPVVSSQKRMQRRRITKRKDDSLWDTVCRGIVDHQLGEYLTTLLRLPQADE